MRNKARANAKHWLALAITAALPAAAMAQPLVLEAQTGPATEAGATVVAAVANPLPAAKNSGGKILILPFQPVNPNDASPWLGKSIQESMAVDLTVAAPDRVISSDQTAGTLDAAVAVGKQIGARYVVAGGFVTVDHDLRITGQVVDVDTGKPVAGLKATGDPSQIFRMEDALALQVRAQVLGQRVSAPQTPGVEQQPQPQQQPQAPQAQLAADEVPATAPGIVTTPQPQEYSSYATAPQPVVYGGDSTAYTYYPSYSASYVSGYDPYYYPAVYSYAPYYSCDYGYYGGCAPFGLGLGFYFGSGFYHNHFGYGRGYDHNYSGRNSYAYRGGYAGGGRTSLGVGVNINAGLRTSSVRGSLSVGSGGVRTAARVSSGTPFRSGAFYQSASFGHSSSIGGFHAGNSFHSSGGFSSHASFGGGGVSHGGGGAGGHGGGGHR